ncbi:MAG: hypothetical protein JXR40_04780 [Pontiellaceae bacterium]|nr:hypothetical protein [Pontiellaceae bacterium]
MKSKVVSLLLLIGLFICFGLSLGFMTGSSSFESYGVPEFFTVFYSWQEDGRLVSQVTFHRMNLFLTVVCLSIPVFIAGVLWGKSNRKN